MLNRAARVLVEYGPLVSVPVACVLAALPTTPGGPRRAVTADA